MADTWGIAEVRHGIQFTGIFVHFFARGIPWASASARNPGKECDAALSQLGILCVWRADLCVYDDWFSIYELFVGSGGVTFPEEAEASFGNGGYYEFGAFACVQIYRIFGGNFEFSYGDVSSGATDTAADRDFLFYIPGNVVCD